MRAGRRAPSGRPWPGSPGRCRQAHVALGHFLLTQNDVAGAERAFRTAADLAPLGSAARVRLADFHLLLHDPQQARGILAGITEKAPDFLPAWRRLAEIALAEGKLDESQKALDALLRKNPAEVDARFLRGRVHPARRETTLAIQEFQAVRKAEPRLAPARHQLALAQLQPGNVQPAKAEIKEAISRAPNFAEALLLLAEVNMQSGAIQPAIEDLERLIAAQPQTPGAYLLGVDSLRVE